VSDDMRSVPLDDELDGAVDLDSDDVLPVRPAESVTPLPSDSRDWDEQGFDANRYEDVPPHWAD